MEKVYTKEEQEEFAKRFKSKSKDNVEPIQKPDVSKYKLLNFTDLKNRELKETEYVLHPILPTQGIAIVYAGTGVGKTLFTLNLAYSIAQGGDFLKYKCPQPRKVLYVDGEMPFNQLHKRLMQINKRSGELHFEQNLSILTPDVQEGLKIPNIDEEMGQFIYQELINLHDYEVIVFDNLSMLSSIDENKSHEWKIVQSWFLTLRALGKTVILVHHSGKDTGGYRGTSRMLDCVDTAISLQAVDEDGLEDENINIKKIKVSYRKARGFGGQDALAFEINLENGFWSYRSSEQSDIERVVEMLKDGFTQQVIAQEIGCKQSKISKLKKKAIKMGLFHSSK